MDICTEPCFNLCVSCLPDSKQFLHSYYFKNQENNNNTDLFNSLVVVLKTQFSKCFVKLRSRLHFLSKERLHSNGQHINYMEFWQLLCEPS